jgi:hypothetical protein
MAAHEKGLNISQICEQTLKTAVQKGGNLRTVGSGWWTGGDLNPRPPECKSGVHARLNYQPSV